MNIVVCVKQVPSTDTVRFDTEKGTLIREGIETEVNPYDLFALEAGVELKERFGGSLTCISMGPPQAEEALRECISRGADKGILLSDRAFAGSDTLATTYILSKAIQRLGEWDLVLCGKQTTDGDTAQVAPGLSVRLSVPCVTCVTRMEPVEQGIKIWRRLEEGEYVVKTAPPLVASLEMGANTPRLPSLKGKMRAKKAEIPVWTASYIGADTEKIGLLGSPTEVYSTYVPEFKARREMIEGQVEEQAKRLVTIIKEALGGHAS